jgi:hypothetical protein
LYPTNPFRYEVKPAPCSTAFGPLKYSSIAAAIGSIDEAIVLVVTFSNADGDEPLSSSFSSTNTIFTLIDRGVDVIVAVADGARVGALLGVVVGEEVEDGVKDFVAVGNWATVGVFEGATVNVLLGTDVGLSEGVTDGVKDGLTRV